MKKNYKLERLGEVKIDKHGCEMKIVEYNKATDIIVEFQDGYKSLVHTSYDSFVKNKVKNPSYRLGISNFNYQNCKMTIVEYNNCDDIIVEFQDKYKAKIHAQYADFKKGSISNPYYPSVCGIGFLGEGKHIAWEDNKNTKKYDAWNNMIKRAYNKNLHKKHPTYEDCSVCKEWHNFQNFGDWYDENYYNVEGSTMHLDKDILFKGNKIYSPNTCIFVPKNINSLFTKRDNNRGKFPIGVHYRKDNNKYRAVCSNQLAKKHNKKTQVNLGQFDTPIKAFNAYKKYKEQHIKDVADFYKDEIPKKLYDALYAYEVEITD